MLDRLATHLLLLAGSAAVLAHPGADVRTEFLERQEHLNNPARRTLSECHARLEARGHYAAELERRMTKIDGLRSERGLQAAPGAVQKRAGGARAACVLDPEVTEGPYWVQGEVIRPDIREESAGVVLHLDINVIDVTTCEPIPDAYVELWGCNSTGVYTGVVAEGNGAGLSAPEEINNSALRGVQPTDANGIASFVTVVPGHYVGRTNHLHTIVHHGANKLSNDTIQGGTISHVGQFYFDDANIEAVESESPYSTNTQPWTRNADDLLLRQGQAGGDNPFIELTLLGGSVADGLHGVIDVGVDPSAKQDPKPVNFWTADGGKPVEGSPWLGYPWSARVMALLRRWVL
ncbi:uncharacterized protein PpBr36_10731 [Pyricularia pennisetigena]|uniref:uncharacterized protein n=1 Tax=Pyricularia pennisetigena TaxID=1578925 RepID=UPI00114EF430|nr:uncharacterized protein PpBr36_10731 [Pyricularia pennisetigena]TLS20922.1 hypothetical protein PpBr36_10731 [Pyricularia pennisetigena]